MQKERPEPASRPGDGGRSVYFACTFTGPGAGLADVGRYISRAYADPEADRIVIHPTTASPCQRSAGQSGEAMGEAISPVIASVAKQSPARCAPGWGLPRRFAPRNDREAGSRPAFRRSPDCPASLAAQPCRPGASGLVSAQSVNVSQRKTRRTQGKENDHVE